MGRFVFPLWGPLDRWWVPCYLRLKLELVLTPIRVSEKWKEVRRAGPTPERHNPTGPLVDVLLPEADSGASAQLLTPIKVGG